MHRALKTMDPTYTGRKEIRHDGQDFFAEVTIRFLPGQGGRGVGFSSEARRYLNSRFGADSSKRGDHIWQAVVALIDGSGRQLAKLGIWANTFRTEVVSVEVSENASEEDLAYLLAEASKMATETFFADLDDGHVGFTAADLKKPFELLPHEWSSMNPIERYIAIDMEPAAIRALERHRPVDIEEVRENRCLTPNGDRFFLDAVVCYLARRTQEGDELVAKSRAFLELAHATSEREKYDYTRGYSEGCRSAVLSYVRWLTDGTSSSDLIKHARMNLSAYYSRTRSLDRNAATIAVPMLLYTESYTLIRKIAERFSIGTEPNRKPTGLIGHAFRIASAADDSQRQDEKERLRKQIPKQLSRWIDRGHYGDVAYTLHALFPRPEGPPSRLIERCWQYIDDRVVEKSMRERGQM
jgi:hypothetical protein